MTPTYWIGLCFAGLILVSIFLRMRNQGMKERYATWWLVIALVSAVISMFPVILRKTALSLGVQVPLNLAFFLAGIVMLLLSLRFSVDLSRTDEERRRLTEEIAFLRAEVDELKEINRAAGRSLPAPGTSGGAPEGRSADSPDDPL